MSGSDEATPSGWSPNTMSAAQSRAARGMLGWSLGDLAAKSGLDEGLVRSFEENVGDVASGQVEALRSTLMRAGVVFTDGASPGVRMESRHDGDGTRLSDLTTENDR